MGTIILTAFVVIVAIVAIMALFSTFFIVNTSTVGVVERFGRFIRMAGPGFNVKIPFVDSVTQTLSLRVQQLVFDVETKTKDNVSVKISVSTQFSVDPENLEDAAYKLSNVNSQIASYIYDAVRSVIPTMTLDEAFEKKVEIADDVDKIVKDAMTSYGYVVNKVLVTDILPDAKVRDAMNEINSAERKKQAATANAEAYRIEIVGKAQGEAEAKKLSGEGVANQRKAIADGLAAQSKALKEAGVEDADTILLINQYLDTLTNVVSNSKTNTIMLPNSPSGVTGLADELRTSIISARSVNTDN